MQQSKPKSVVVVEDNRSFAKVLAKMLEVSENTECLGVFHSAEAFKEQKDPIDNADLVLLDLHLPGESGLDLIPHLRDTLPSAKIIVLTQDDNYLKTLDAIRLGVSGYLLKRSTIDDLERAIDEVSQGGCVIDPYLCRIVMDTLGGEEREAQSVLSWREQQVLELLALGKPKKEIAQILNISYRTVAHATERVYSKLQVPNVAAAVAKAIRTGMI